MMKAFAVMLMPAVALMAGIASAEDRPPDATGRLIAPEAVPAAPRSTDPATRPVPGTVVYRSSFDKGKTDGWTSAKALPPDKTTGTLRPLHNQTLRLRLGKIPQHKFLHLRVQFYLIESWDGDGAHATDGDAPDRITIKLAGGRKLLDASFAVMQSCGQSYPDNGPWVRHRARTGAVKHIPGGQYGQSLYSLAMSFPHTDENAILEFTGALTEQRQENRNVANECWGLGGVVVSALPVSPVKLDEKRFRRLWAQLADKDPLKANQAVWTLISAGRDALPHIEKILDPPNDETLPKRVAELIRRLDDENWPVRQKATAELKGLGKPALPLLQKALAGNPSLEVRARINRILSGQEGAAARRMRAGRARWVLQVIGGPKAAAMRKALPAPKRFRLPTPAKPPVHRRLIIQDDGVVIQT